MRERGWQAALRERYGDSKFRTGADAGDAGGDAGDAGGDAAAALFAARRAGAAVVCAAVVAALGEAGAPPSPQASGLLAPPRQTPKADFEALRAAAAVLRGAERPLEALDVGEFLIDPQRAGAVAALVGVMHLRDTGGDTGTDDTGGRLRALQVALPHLNGGTRHVRVLMWTLGRLMIHAGWRAKDDLATHSFTITELIRGAIAGPMSKVNLSDGIRLGNKFVGTAEYYLPTMGAEYYRSSCTGVIAACRALSSLDRGVGGEVRRLTAMPTIDGDVEV